MVQLCAFLDATPAPIPTARSLSPHNHQLQVKLPPCKPLTTTSLPPHQFPTATAQTTTQHALLPSSPLPLQHRPARAPRSARPYRHPTGTRVYPSPQPMPGCIASAPVCAPTGHHVRLPQHHPSYPSRHWMRASLLHHLRNAPARLSVKSSPRAQVGWASKPTLSPHTLHLLPSNTRFTTQSTAPKTRSVLCHHPELHCLAARATFPQRPIAPILQPALHYNHIPSSRPFQPTFAQVPSPMRRYLCPNSPKTCRL